MAGNTFFQNLDPQVAPDPVTPAATPSEPAGYAMVTPPGTGAAPAPYDISAPQNIAGITASFNAANALTGGQEGAGTGAGSAGMPNRNSPRQQQAAAILDSPQGAESSNVFAGFPDYENQDLRPGGNMENPIQGHTADYPGTTQAGITQFTAGFSAGLPGVPPETGSMSASGGGDYPGTTQDGLPVYGTS
jgi:hypothetical protein